MTPQLGSSVMTKKAAAHVDVKDAHESVSYCFYLDFLKWELVHTMVFFGFSITYEIFKSEFWKKFPKLLSFEVFVGFWKIRVLKLSDFRPELPPADLCLKGKNIAISMSETKNYFKSIVYIEKWQKFGHSDIFGYRSE